MSSNLDDLESMMTEDMRGTYTDTAIDHAMNPRNVGSIQDEDGFGSVDGPCGDNMEIWLKVKNGNIQNATFWTDGCGTTIAAGSVVTELAKGKSVAEAQRISDHTILDFLGGFPEESVHCATLAANTLKEAIKDYLAFKNEPWKRNYRRT